MDACRGESCLVSRDLGAHLGRLTRILLLIGAELSFTHTGSVRDERRAAGLLYLI